MAENFSETIAVLRKGITDLQAKIDDLTEAITLLWLDADRSKWDEKAVERFDRLVGEA